MKSEGKGDDGKDIVSYRRLRKAVGTLGATLPLILIVGCIPFGTPLQHSISAYYGTPMGDVLVGALVAIAGFLIVYRGYNDWDDWAGNLAGIAMLGVAFFPSTSADGWVRKAHGLAAFITFGMLAYFSGWLFTKSDAKKPLPRKKQERNIFYRLCAGVIVFCILAIGAFMLTPLGDTQLATYRPVLWLEWSALAAFSASWALKGESVVFEWWLGDRAKLRERIRRAA